MGNDLPSIKFIVGWAAFSLVVGVVAGALQPWPGDVQLARTVGISLWSVGSVIAVLWKGRHTDGTS